MGAHGDGSVTFSEQELRELVRAVYRAGAHRMREALEDKAFSRDFAADTRWIAETRLPEGPGMIRAEGD